MDNNTSSDYRDIDLKKVLADMARAIVDNPDQVTVEEDETESGTVLTLKVAEDDMGMIIGKHGKIARALRSVIKAAAKIADKKVTVEIKE
ncbi:MAG: KH domain-containing protein [Ruminococcaceae bacterium]|nr:KH domain-containing protein [Oscillospiraceae bacterium]